MDIPFRCPSCGDSEKFSSLRELRCHLETRHAYKSGQLQKGLSMPSRNHFDEPRIEYHSPLLDLYHADAKKLEENIKKLKEDELNNKRQRNKFPEPNHAGVNVAERRSRKVANISDKSSFRKYGHPSRQNRYFNPSKFPAADSSKIGYTPHSFNLWSDEDLEDDSNPHVSNLSPNSSENGSGNLRHETSQNFTYVHSSSKVDSFRDLHQRLPQSKPPGDKYVNETLTALSHEVMMERASQQATADSLYAAQEVLSGIEQAAECRIAQQQQVIESLALQLKEKERRMNNAMQEMESLRHLQFQNMERVSILRQRSDEETKHLHQELLQKQKELDELNTRIDATRQTVMHSTPSAFEKPVKLTRAENGNTRTSNNFNVPQMPLGQFMDSDSGPALFGSGSQESVESIIHQPVAEKVAGHVSPSKEDELRKVKTKAQQLERDRQNLLLEMQNLLESAATDNDKLQTELENQREKLGKLTSDLEHSKKEQEELLGETSTLYLQADVSLAKLKTMLKERDQQLSNLSGSLFNAKETQERLAKERDECKRLAEEREAAYQSVLASNSSQVRSLRETLECHQSEKLKLEQNLQQLKTDLAAKDEKDHQLSENVSRLRSELAEREKHQAKLKEELRKREEKLRKAKHEMERVTAYLKSTAEKELEARSKLEEFISGLIDRAAKAEAELEKLRASYHSRKDGQKKLSKRNRVPDLSRFPGVTILQDQSRKHGVMVSDAEEYSHLEAYSQPKANYTPFHSTPKAHKHSAWDAHEAVQKSSRNDKDRRTFKSASPHRSPKRRPQMEDGKDNAEQSDRHNYSDSNVSKIPSVHSTSQPNQLSIHVSGDTQQPAVADKQGSPFTTVNAIDAYTSLPQHAYVAPEQQVFYQPPHLSNSQEQILLAGHTMPVDGLLVPQQQPSNPTTQEQRLQGHPTLQFQTLHANTNILPKLPVYQPGMQTLTQHVNHSNTLYPQSSTVVCQPQGNAEKIGFLDPIMAKSSNLQHPDYSNYNISDIQQKLSLFTPNTDAQLDPSSNTFLNNLMHANISTTSQHQFTGSNAPFIALSSTEPYACRFSYREDKLRNIESHQPQHSMTYLYSMPTSYSLGSQPTVTNNTDIYAPAYPYGKTPLIFENTPEVERMIRNVSKQQYAQTAGPVSDWLLPQRQDFGTRTQPTRKELLRGRDLSLDDNGIMWEKASPYSLPDTQKQSLISKGAFVSSLGKPYTQKTEDDTDIDEDITDYLYEDQESHDKVTKAKMSALEQNPLPLGDKIAKLLTSLGPEATSSTARQTYNKNIYSQESQQPKFDSEASPNKSSGLPKAAHEYSTTESSDASPLIKAKHVQRRLEQLTSPEPKPVRLSASSKQSDGFEVSQFDAETDISSSSYASLTPVVARQESVNKEPVVRKDNANRTANTAIHDIQTNDPVHERQFKASSNKSDLRNENRLIKTRSIAREHSIDAGDIITTDVNPDNSSNFVVSGSISPEPRVGNHTSVKNSGEVENKTDFSKTKSAGMESENHPSANAKEHQRPNLAEEANKTAEPLPVAQSQQSNSEELVRYTDAELKPAKELRARFVPSDTQASSSEDDLPEDHGELEEPSDSATPHQSLPRKASVDVGTDTDLEKLAMPGYMQKGLVVKKNGPAVRKIKRKKSRPKTRMKKFPSQESVSSSADDLDEEQRARRQANRRRRVALFRIFGYLDTPTLLLISCVSKEWCKVSRHPALWKYVTLKDSAISSEFLITLSQWCTKTQFLSLQDLRGREMQENEAEEDYQQAIRGSLEPGLEKFLSACQDAITKLHIKNCDNILTDKCLWLVSGYCRLLTSLTYQSSVDPITPQLMWALGGGCPGVTSLFVQPQHPCQKTNAMNNRCLLLIGQFYVDLQELGLAGKEFDRAGLVPLVQSCQHLRILHLDHCLPVTADLVSAVCKAGLKHLQALSICGTTVEAKALQTFQGSCRQLKRINVTVTLQDCVADPTKKKDKETYKKMVKALEDLKKKSGFGIIYTLEAAPVD